MDELITASASASPVRRADLVTRTIHDETVVLDGRNGCVHQLNKTASCVWARCDGSQTAADIAAHLTERYEVQPDRALTDVVATLADLRRLGLVMGNEHSGEVTRA